MNNKCSCDKPKIKKNFPFGKKSRAIKHCRRCGNIVTNYDIVKKRSNKRK